MQHKKFKQYTWQAYDNNSHTTTHGSVTAPSSHLAKQYLHNQGFQDIQINTHTETRIAKNTAFKQKHLQAFCQQLATLLGAGIDLIAAIKILRKNSQKPRIKKQYHALLEQLEQGHSFCAALDECALMTDRFYLKFIEVGEHSGNLENMLAKLASHLHMRQRLQTKMTSAMIYPSIVIATTIIVVTFLLLFIIPQFDSLFRSFGAELPALTRSIIDISVILTKHGLYFITILIIAIILLILTLKHSLYFQRLKRRLIYSMPIVGYFIRLNIITRFCHTLGTLLAAGITLYDALDMLKDISAYPSFTQAIEELQQCIQNGHSLSASMQQQSIWPPEVIQMIDTGENSGNMEELLLHLAYEYDAKIAQQIDNMSTLIEPLLMLILGVIVAFIITAMYLPVFQMGSIL